MCAHGTCPEDVAFYVLILQWIPIYFSRAWLWLKRFA